MGRGNQTLVHCAHSCPSHFYCTYLYAVEVAPLAGAWSGLAGYNLLGQKSLDLLALHV
jgi:hypothetical protein